MRILSNQDYRLFERLVSLTQKGLHQAMAQYLKEKYEKVIVTKDYIVAIGDIPIALVAHMDTVFKNPVADLYYDQRKGVLWSPQGLGADDRAGIFAILKIIQSGLRPAIIFTTDEEKGGLGATALGSRDCPIPGLKYMIQLDRHGTNDCVFYECFNEDFYDYVEKTYTDLYDVYSAQRIEGLIRSIIDKYRLVERQAGSRIINTVLMNAIVPQHYLADYYDFNLLDLLDEIDEENYDNISELSE